VPKPNSLPVEDNDWEKILDEIDIQHLPIEYVSQIVITFVDGTTWDIDIDDSRKNQTVEEIEDSLDDVFDEFDDTIESLDFRLDIERVKKDLSKRVYKFLKLNK